MYGCLWYLHNELLGFIKTNAHFTSTEAPHETGRGVLGVRIARGFSAQTDGGSGATMPPGEKWEQWRR